jgi:cyanophycinase-like exopeptidase
MGGRTFLLLGSGEFEPWSEQPERIALGGRPQAVAILPTASAPEGDAVFDRWASMGVGHYAAMGVEPRVVPLERREDAERDEVISMLDDVGMAFFSGGNPRFLADTLRGTRFFARLAERLQEGLVFAGCSAGAMVASHDPSARPRFGAAWAAGLGLVPGVAFGAHWNRMRAIPGLRPFVMSRAGQGWYAGIDERTAILGDGRSWRVYGSGSVALRRDGRTSTIGPGESFETG